MIVVKARIRPTAAGTNQTIFSKGTSLGSRTNKGVIPCPNTIPIGWDKPITAVASGPYDIINIQCKLNIIPIQIILRMSIK